MKLNELDHEARINLASEKVRKLVDHVRHVIDLHKSNQIISYSPKLSDQIPKSYAAHAFNLFQDGLLRYEVIRICAVWDSARKDDLELESIPTLIMLIDDEAIQTQLIKKIASNRLNRPAPRLMGEPIDFAVAETFKAVFARDAAKDSAKFSRFLKSAFFHSKKIEESEQLVALRNFRNKHLAHSLANTREELRGPIALPHYGYERYLLFRSIMILDWLYLCICDTSYDWKESLKIAQNNAESLWNGCAFNVFR